MKRSTYLLAAPLLALSLAACGGADETTETPQATEDAAEEQAAEPTDEAEESTPEDEAEAETETSEDESPEAAEEEESAEEGTSEDSGGEADGSRENPYAVGDTISLTDWDITVNSVNPDAAEEVMAENQFNEPPAEGRQFVLVNLDATYTGDDASNFWVDITTKVLGSEGNTFGGEMDDSCGTIPGDLFNAGEQFPGSTETGNVCVSVPAEQLDGALLLVEETFSFEDSRVFVALD